VPHEHDSGWPAGAYSPLVGRMATSSAPAGLPSATSSPRVGTGTVGAGSSLDEGPGSGSTPSIGVGIGA